MKDQHNFLILCIEKILSLYPVNNRPESVVIIGHSMVSVVVKITHIPLQIILTLDKFSPQGGMIARSLFVNDNFDVNTVKLIITLATPHEPVILIDQDLTEFYDLVEYFWEEEKSRNHSRLENVTLISIGGGIRDILVRPGLTYNKHADLNVLVSVLLGIRWRDVDGLWLETWKDK